MPPERASEKAGEGIIRDVLATINSRTNIISTNVPPAFFEKETLGFSSHWIGTKDNDDVPPTGILTKLEGQSDGLIKADQILYLDGKAYEWKSTLYPQGTLPAEFRGLI